MAKMNSLQLANHRWYAAIKPTSPGGRDVIKPEMTKVLDAYMQDDGKLGRVEYENLAFFESLLDEPAEKEAREMTTAFMAANDPLQGKLDGMSYRERAEFLQQTGGAGPPDSEWAKEISADQLPEAVRRTLVPDAESVRTAEPEAWGPATYYRMQNEDGKLVGYTAFVPTTDSESYGGMTIGYAADGTKLVELTEIEGT